MLYILVEMFNTINHYFKHRNCIHDTYFETRACNAICIKCGKNLGFIQDQRNKFPKGEEWRNQPHVPR